MANCKEKKSAGSHQLKKDDTVKVIAGRDKGKTGRVLRVDRETGRDAGGARDDDQAAHASEPGQADQGRHRRARKPDRGFERDDRVPASAAGADRHHVETSLAGGKTRRTRVCRKCGQTLDKK
jgi:large subunit ribosomal protein L24